MIKDILLGMGILFGISILIVISGKYLADFIWFIEHIGDEDDN